MTSKKDKKKSKKKNVISQNVKQSQVVKINIGDFKRRKTKTTERKKPKPPSGYYPSELQRSTISYNSIPSLVNPQPLHPSVYNFRRGDTAPFYISQPGVNQGERMTAQGNRIVSVDDNTNTLSRTPINPLLRTPIVTESENIVSSIRKTPIKEFTDTITSAIKETPISIYGTQNIKDKERRSAVDMLFGLSGRPRISEAPTQLPNESNDESDIFTVNDQSFQTPMIGEREVSKEEEEEKASINTDFGNDDDQPQTPIISRSISIPSSEVSIPQQQPEEEQVTSSEIQTSSSKKKRTLLSSLRKAITPTSKVVPDSVEQEEIIQDKIATEPSLRRPLLPFLADLKNPFTMRKTEKKAKPTSFLEEMKQGKKLKKVQFEEKKSEEAQAKPPPIAFNQSLLDAVALRRQKIAPDDDDNDDAWSLPPSAPKERTQSPLRKYSKNMNKEQVIRELLKVGHNKADLEQMKWTDIRNLLKRESK